MAKDIFLKLQCSITNSTKFSTVTKPAHRLLFIGLMIQCQREMITEDTVLTPIVKGLLKAFVPTNERGLNTAMLKLVEANLIEENGWVINFREMTSTVDSRRQAKKRERDMSRDMYRESSDRSQKSEVRSKSKSKNKKVRLPSFEKETKDVLDYLNKASGRGFKTSSHLKARLKDGVTVDQCRHVIDFKANEYRSRGNGSMQYLRPSTLFGPNNFKVFLEDSEGWEPGASSEPKAIPFSQGELDVIARLNAGDQDG